MATATRAGYTVTMFIIDVSPSMGTLTTVDVPAPDGTVKTVEMTRLQRAVLFVKLKIQDLIYYERKTDQCGVILLGSEESNNIVNRQTDGYLNVSEYIPIGKPSFKTLALLDALQPTTVSADPIDALVVALETQKVYLTSKPSWTRKVYLLTDGEAPIELDDWESIIDQMNASNISMVIVGVDFDDEDYDFKEPNKNKMKRVNEIFYAGLAARLTAGHVGNLEHALDAISAPEAKLTKSAMLTSTLRIGDPAGVPDEAVEIDIRVSKATAAARPKAWKKFALREDGPSESAAYVQLTSQRRLFVDPNEGSDDEDENGDGDVNMVKTEPGAEDAPMRLDMLQVEPEEMVKGYKYGTTYVPCPTGAFNTLPTVKGFDLCGFFPAKNFRRELIMGEVSYIWANPKAPHEQVKLSAIVKAMGRDPDRPLMAIARYVAADDRAPRMGVLVPCEFENVDCLLFAVMPFADDVRRYTFASLDHLVNKKGEVVTEHAYLPTEVQRDAMDNFVDAMDLADVGDKDEEGNRTAWYSPQQAYNPALHRVKQAQYHCAVVPDVVTFPVPPPRPELTMFFDPPKRALKRARDALEECVQAFGVKKVPKRIARVKKLEHVHAHDEDDDLILLDAKGPRAEKANADADADDAKEAAEGSATEEDTDGEDLLLGARTPAPGNSSNRHNPLPTPGRSVSPAAGNGGRAPGRIIGNAHPLRDFRANIAQGDIVSKAVEDLAAVVREEVGRPFASRRTGEMLECMEMLRRTCLEEDEVDAWNDFLTQLKRECLSRRGNAEFWEEVQKLGTDLTLISKTEAKRLGGDSKISENEASEFMA